MKPDEYIQGLRLGYTLGAARSFAAQFGRADAFEQESKEPRFANAAAMYSVVLWNWVREQASDGFVKHIDSIAPADVQLPNNAESHRLLIVAKLQYLFRRTLFLTGLRYEKAREPQWYKDFAGELLFAKKLNDEQVFEALAAVKERRRLKKTTRGKLKYEILRGWLAGGLWKMANDEKRAERLKQLLCLPNTEFTTGGFKVTRQRMKLAAPP